MNNPQVLHQQVLTSLAKEGYNVLPLDIYNPKFWIRTCFDIAARKEILLMIKLFMNIDKIPASLVEDLKLISYFLEGIPLIIGNETRNSALREDVIYERKGIPALNLTTFRHILKENKLYIISRKGGFYVRVDKEKIHQLRIQQGYSLQAMASQMNVSRKAVYLFERIEMIKEENADQLEKILEKPLKSPINIFDWEINKKEIQKSVEETEFQMEIKENLEELGFNIYWAKKAPFDGITSEIDESHPKTKEKCLITGLSSSHGKKVYDRLKLISNISKLARKLSMFIIEGAKVPQVDNVLILQKEILDKMKDIEDLQKELKKVTRIFY